jgi:hypothetical protein
MTDTEDALRLEQLRAAVRHASLDAIKREQEINSAPLLLRFAKRHADAAWMAALAAIFGTAGGLIGFALAHIK